MGMDLYIYRARNHEIFKHDNWYESPNVTEVFYARKYWAIPEHCSFIPSDYESGDFIQLTEDDLKDMIKVACEYRDYFDTYNNVPKLCELRDKFDEIEEEGDHLFLEYDW